MAGAEGLDVPHVGGAVEGALVSHFGRALVSEHVLRMELAALGALGQAAVRHGGRSRPALCLGVLRLFAGGGGSVFGQRLAVSGTTASSVSCFVRVRGLEMEMETIGT